MPLSSGDKLGPYEIDALIGAGGMGEVYKARDTRLNRIVAIKVSQTRFSDRFEREARAVAALNHTNICQLYDVGENFLVMEFVDGAPVTAPDTPRKLLDLAVQIADGLSAAHAAALVHRDLKPDNILITGAQSAQPGRVKILDFGLAKNATEPALPDDATRALSLTDPGTTVGTAAYMSPEQARGIANLTPQSDQFSFGLVLYELAAGKRAFVRASIAETMTAIIREEAEPLPSTVPAPLRWVIERLLAKEPADRYDSTRDLYRELKQIRERYSEVTSAQQIPVVAAPVKKRRVLVPIGFAAAALAGAAVAALLIHPQPADLSAYKFTPIVREEATERSPAWSPDGKSIAYTASIHGIAQVFTKALGAPDAAQLTHASEECGAPFWSPDGATIYYSSRSSGGVALWAVGASGGTPRLVMEKASAAGLHPDGKSLVFERDGRIWASSLQGGSPREFWRSPSVGLNFSSSPFSLKFAPDGSRLAATDGGEIRILPWPSGTPRNFGAVGSGVSWLPDSRHVLVGDGAAGASETLSLLDTTDGSRRVIYRATDSIVQPSVSPDGKKIAYSAGATEWDVLEISVPEGRVHTMVGGGGVSWLPDWAPSGTHFLFSHRLGDWVIEDRSAAEGFSRRVTEVPPGSVDFNLYSSRWAPDGKRLLFLQGPVAARLQLTMANVSGGALDSAGGRWQLSLCSHLVPRRAVDRFWARRGRQTGTG
jgi:eukaryotic-like serine/threonine-protein kinase